MKPNISCFKLLDMLLILLLCVCCLYSCVSPALAFESESDTSITEDVSVTDVDVEILNQLEIITGLLENMSGQTEPVEGEITQAQFNSYVLGCLLFFVIVILAYFACKFFAMFF